MVRPISCESMTAADDPDPSGDTDSLRKLHARIRLKWAGQVAVVAGLVGVVAGIISTRVGWLTIPMAIGLAAAVATVGFVWVILRYRAWGFQLRADALYLEYGVITRVETVVPHVRIQHVDTSRGPVDRLLGLSTLVVYTAGSRGADVSIPGLPAQSATEHQRRVKELAIEAEDGGAV